MSPTLLNILIVIGTAILAFSVGLLIGWRLRRPNRVGTLLLIKDPIDGETFMNLEIDKRGADYIYDGNEISLQVLEILSKGPRKTQSL